MISLLLFAAAPQSITAVIDAYPSLSSDGRSLVFQSNRSGRQALWLAGPDGANPRLFFDRPGGNPSEPVWSPDGTRIAFAMTPDGGPRGASAIYVLERTGDGQLRRLTAEPGDWAHPHWSADGRRIFFNGPSPDPSPDGREATAIYSANPDGSSRRMHLACEDLCTYPSPSPDGRWITFRKVVNGPGRNWAQQPIARNSEVFISRMDGSAARNISNDPAFDGWPAWSRDGQWVVFASARDGRPNAGQIYRVRLSGGRPERLTPDDGWSRAQPSLAADGGIFVYEQHEDTRTEIGHIARIAPYGAAQ